jgi:hypothetical protein
VEGLADVVELVNGVKVWAAAVVDTLSSSLVFVLRGMLPVALAVVIRAYHSRQWWVSHRCLLGASHEGAVDASGVPVDVEARCRGEIFSS